MLENRTRAFIIKMNSYLLERIGVNLEMSNEKLSSSPIIPDFKEPPLYTHFEGNKIRKLDCEPIQLINQVAYHRFAPGYFPQRRFILVII